MEETVRAIQEVLALRTDLSTFLVHLTKESDTQTAADRLRNIVRDRTLRAGDFMPPLSTSLGLPPDSQRVVCFTETPLHLVSLLLGTIGQRNNTYSPYGLAITKRGGRLNGVNPVWYLDTSSGAGANDPWLSKNFANLWRAVAESTQSMKSASAALENGIGWVGASDPSLLPDLYAGLNSLARAAESLEAAREDIASLAPHLQVMGTHENGKPNEFWWEREWRHPGDFTIPQDIHYIVLCPEEEIPAFESLSRMRALDPRWSLEEMIAHLSNFDRREVRQL